MELTIGVDVGGTKIAAGVVDADGRILERLRVPTPETVELIDASIAEAVEKLKGTAPGAQVSAVGVAAAGFVNEHRTTVRFAPNIAWREHPLAEAVGGRVGLPVVVENDANAAAWAEFRFGAGLDVSDMVMVTVGTGVGGGIVLDGKLVRGAFGIAAEIGHLRVAPNGRPCGCGQLGCWEQYASGRALVRAARDLAISDPEAAAPLLAAAGGQVDRLVGSMITEVALAGDPAAVGLFAQLGRWLGEGVASLANLLDPAVVVIGGGVADAGDLLMVPAREAFAEHLSGAANRPHLQLRLAEMGNDAGIIGAADLARTR
ncbi:ROK family glucokinase [Kineosporia rhizophila]|uniref:ROK family glucokinase n=1 Tax=Kineosporia TaxID=49184 RepID=UPI001E4C8469|nr:ROK family glucokinase [Kineosporia sp. NBRC 101677]MCE0538327.1 ROK family glucokinase [Kineosporia rhizophila]GLY18617.1 glucokinase [Kineosporia sp. NBRC 101677]